MNWYDKILHNLMLESKHRSLRTIISKVAEELIFLCETKNLLTSLKVIHSHHFNIKITKFQNDFVCVFRIKLSLFLPMIWTVNKFKRFSLYPLPKCNTIITLNWSYKWAFIALDTCFVTSEYRDVFKRSK